MEKVLQDLHDAKQQILNFTDGRHYKVVDAIIAAEKYIKDQNDKLDQYRKALIANVLQHYCPNSEEVKSCPFCDGEAKLVKGIEYIDDKETSIWQYVCNNKDCLIYEGYARYQLSEEEALKAWNRRWKDAEESKDS